jgi:hypothetical protein
VPFSASWTACATCRHLPHRLRSEPGPGSRPPEPPPPPPPAAAAAVDGQRAQEVPKTVPPRRLPVGAETPRWSHRVATSLRWCYASLMQRCCCCCSSSSFAAASFISLAWLVSNIIVQLLVQSTEVHAVPLVRRQRRGPAPTMRRPAYTTAAGLVGPVGTVRVASCALDFGVTFWVLQATHRRREWRGTEECCG